MKIIRQAHHKGFTLLELILVIAIVASLAGLIFNALNPAQRLDEANDAKVTSTANDIEKAIKVYTVENSGILPTSLSAITATGIYDVCKSGETIGCINLDQLVTSGKLSSIPIDTRYATTHTSGYKIDFNTATSEAKIYSQTEFEVATDFCPPGDTTCLGAVSEWKLDDAAGTTAADSGTNLINASLVGSPVWATGKFNGGVDMTINSVQQLVQVTDGSTGGKLDFSNSQGFTFSIWTKISNTEANFFPMDKGGDSARAGYDILVSSSTNLTSCRYSDGLNSNIDTAVSTTDIKDGVWHLVTCVMDGNGLVTGTPGLYTYIDGKLEGSDTNFSEGDGSGSTETLKIGERFSSEEFDGSLDQARIYNYARTAAQIAWEYDQGAPAGYWKLNENTGSTTADASVNGNNGTINGATWTSGKYGSALTFDGVNDNVAMADNFNLNMGTSDFTFTTWIYGNNINSQDIIVAKSNGDGPSASYGFLFGTFGANLPLLYFATGAVAHTSIQGNVSLSNGQWYHLAVVVDRDSAANTKIYVNGSPVSTTVNNLATNTGAITNTVPFTLGSEADNAFYWDGKIDDVRFFNYALSASQVYQQMHER